MVKLSALKLNTANPRVIKDEKFKKLVQSVKEFPKMMALRPIVIDDDGTILGGNMRYRRCCHWVIRKCLMNGFGRQAN